MKLKKYEASTEIEAMEQVKEELGEDAVILNIKRIKPRGLFAAFRKPHVEVTAAFEEKEVIEKNTEEPKKDEIDERLKAEMEKVKKLEEKLFQTETKLEAAVNKISEKNEKTEKKYKNDTLQIIAENLQGQGVSQKIIDKITDECEKRSNIENLDINIIVKMVYNKIVKIIGKSEELKLNDEEKFAKNVVFLGPTGVGKTTTIAKLSSLFIINEGADVGFITCDTYRIAAVEKLKTYAEILGCDVGVVYSPEDFKETYDNMKMIHDMIFIDTAGRSHKNKDNFDELKALMKEIESNDIYLVLSLTTKYEDLINTVRAYEKVTDFKIILTKADETATIGNILNLCFDTGHEISYISNGQDVPDDFEKMMPEKIAKTLLGSMYE